MENDAHAMNSFSSMADAHVDMCGPSLHLPNNKSDQLSLLGKRKASIFEINPAKVQKVSSPMEGIGAKLMTSVGEMTQMSMSTKAKLKGVETTENTDASDILSQLAQIPDEALLASNKLPLEDLTPVTTLDTVEKEHPEPKHIGSQEEDLAESSVAWLLNYFDEKLLDEEVKACASTTDTGSTELAPKGSRWTKEEIRVLWESIATFGNDWVTISDLCKRRSYEQVKDKARRCLLSKGWKTGKTKAETKIAGLRAKEIASSVLSKSPVFKS